METSDFASSAISIGTRLLRPSVNIVKLPSLVSIPLHLVSIGIMAIFSARNVEILLKRDKHISKRMGMRGAWGAKRNVRRDAHRNVRSARNLLLDSMFRRLGESGMMSVSGVMSVGVALMMGVFILRMLGARHMFCVCPACRCS